MNNSSKHLVFALAYIFLAALGLILFWNQIFDIRIPINNWVYNYKVIYCYSFSLIGFAVYITRKVTLIPSVKRLDEDPTPTYVFYYPTLLLMAASLVFVWFSFFWEKLGVVTYIGLAAISFSCGIFVDNITNVLLQVVNAATGKKNEHLKYFDDINPRVIIPSLTFVYLLILDRIKLSQNFLDLSINTTFWLIGGVAFMSIFRLVPVIIEAIIRFLLRKLLRSQKIENFINNIMPNESFNEDVEGLLVSKYMLFNECVLFSPSIFLFLTYLQAGKGFALAGAMATFLTGLAYLLNYYFWRVKNIGFRG